MRKLFFLSLLLLCPLLLMAQTDSLTVQKAPARFGYLHYGEVFRLMPEYAAAQRNLDELKAKYDAEAHRSETEFQQKFAEFLQGQKDFPPTILQKRQLELKDLMEKSLTFKADVQKLLTQAEAELRVEAEKRLQKAIHDIAMERGYEFVLNTDGNACPFINPAAGEDITVAVKEKLKIVYPLP